MDYRLQTTDFFYYEIRSVCRDVILVVFVELGVFL